MAHLQLPEIVTEEGYWGPPSGASAASVLADEFQQIPFAPFSKNERIGRIADWNSVGTSGGDERNAASTASRSARAPRANQGSAYGPNAGLNTFAYFHGEDESSFSVVDNSRSSATRRGAASSACLLYTSPSPRDLSTSRMPSSA